MTRAGTRRRAVPAVSRASCPAKNSFLPERDINMSEQEQKSKSFMQELNQWTDTSVVKPLVQAVTDDLKSADPAFWKEVVETVKSAIRAKVLESYRNGQAVGPRQAKQPQKGGR
jgi:hypothetical protein